MKISRRRVALLSGLLVTAAVAVLAPFQTSRSDGAAATWSQGALRVSVPYEAARAGSGELAVELLNPEDEVLARSARRVEVAAGKARWEEELRLAKAPSLDDLVWHRLRYRFTYTGEKEAAVAGTESLSEILRRPVLHVMGHRAYAAGGAAAVRLLVTDAKNEPVWGTVRVALIENGGGSRSCSAGS